MEITAAIKKNILTVKLTGELDHHTAKEVKDLIEEMVKNRNIKNLVFDFTGLTFMDSSGIGVIIGRYKLINSIGGKVAIAASASCVMKLLFMSGINKIIDIFDTPEAAIISLQEDILC